LMQDVAEGFVARGTDDKSRAREARPGYVGTAVTDRVEAPQSFDEVFLGNYARVVGILRRVVGDYGRAEELASEVFLKLYTQKLAVNGVGSVSGWLYRTATNMGIDALRAASRRSRLEQAAVREGSGERVVENPFEQMARAEKQQRVRGVLADLKPAQAQLLLLRASGHRYRELAAALEIEAGSVGTSLVRAEAAFAQRYRELYGDREDV
jgi:RNA polymerase sigma factor (sigma-70 family)